MLLWSKSSLNHPNSCGISWRREAIIHHDPSQDKKAVDTELRLIQAHVFWWKRTSSCYRSSSKWFSKEKKNTSFIHKNKASRTHDFTLSVLSSEVPLTALYISMMNFSHCAVPVSLPSSFPSWWVLSQQILSYFLPYSTNSTQHKYI